MTKKQVFYCGFSRAPDGFLLVTDGSRTGSQKPGFPRFTVPTGLVRVFTRVSQCSYGFLLFPHFKSPIISLVQTKLWDVIYRYIYQCIELCRTRFAKEVQFEWSYFTGTLKLRGSSIQTDLGANPPQSLGILRSIPGGI